ncbi:MAG: TolC family protein [Pseudomonadota bacterium]
MKRSLIMAYTALLVLALMAALPQAVAADTQNPANAQAAANATEPGQYLGDCAELAELAGYLRQAAAGNNELRAAFRRWEAAVSRAARTDVLPDPMFNFGYYTTPLETRGGPARYKYGLSQSLPFFGKLGFKEQMALREADGVKAQLDGLKLSTFYEVKRVYYEYAYLVRAIAITTESMELLRYLERIATARYTTGSASHADIIRPQVQMGRLEDRLNSLKDLRAPLVARLNALLDRPAGTDIPPPPSIPVMVATEQDDTLFAELPTNNPQLAYWDAVVGMEQAGRNLAERAYYPDFTFGVDVTEVDKARNPGVTGDGRNPIMTSMSFNIPIWQEARGAAVDESQARILAAKRSRAGLEQKLRADLELALYKYRDAGRKINLYRDTLVPKAEQALGVILEAFTSSAATSLDLIDTERTLLELKLDYSRALTDQAQQLAEIETLVGRELPCEFHGSLLGETRLEP